MDWLIVCAPAESLALAMHGTLEEFERHVNTHLEIYTEHDPYADSGQTDRMLRGLSHNSWPDQMPTKTTDRNILAALLSHHITLQS